MNKPRLILFDNLKGILISLVVISHYWGTGFVHTNKTLPLINIFYVFVCTFHMSLFVFIAGYFSKDAVAARNSAINKLLVPYLLFNGLYALIYGEHLIMALLPNDVLWFLFALIIWRSLLPIVSRWKHVLIVSVVMAIVSRFIFDPRPLEIMKMISFTPFFLLGYYTDSQTIARIRSIPKTVIIPLFFSCVAVVYALAASSIFPYFITLFSSRTPFGIEGIIWTGKEILSLLIGTIISICLINIVSEKKSFLTSIGAASLSVYLFHSLPYLRDALYVLNPFHTIWPSIAYWLILAALAIFLFSRSVFTGILKKMTLTRSTS